MSVEGKREGVRIGSPYLSQTKTEEERDTANRVGEKTPSSTTQEEKTGRSHRDKKNLDLQ